MVSENTLRKITDKLHLIIYFWLLSLLSFEQKFLLKNSKTLEYEKFFKRLWQMKHMNNGAVFPDAFDYIDRVIKKLSSYSKTLSTFETVNDEQKKKFYNHAEDMKQITVKWSNGMNKCLEQNDVNVLISFGNFLVDENINKYFHSVTINQRLKLFWIFLQNIPDKNVDEVINGNSNITQNFLNSPTIERIRTVKENTEIIINSVRERNYDTSNPFPLLDIPAILLTIMIRSEAHEYTINQIIERAKKSSKTTIESAETLSVHNKISKGQKDKPDTRAIRDATAHAKFKIEPDNNGDYIIKYNNTEDGYSFVKNFSRKDLLIFYQDYERMTILHTILFTIRLLVSFLRLFYVK